MDNTEDLVVNALQALLKTNTVDTALTNIEITYLIIANNVEVFVFGSDTSYLMPYFKIN